VPFVTFTLLPAVDVADGRAVRLVQGEAGTETTYGDPRATALAWQAAGAEWIHLVDLDAAFGRGSNSELLAAVIEELDVKVELSGGIGADASLDKALATGCARVNLSTAALDDPAWCARAIAAHGDRVAVSLDVRVVEGPGGSTQHRLAARGGTADGGDLWDTLARLDRDGCARYVVTDVSRDGMLRGPNVQLYRAVTRATTAPVIASGGISSIEDLVVLAEAAAAGANLEGSIVGKALYAGRFTLPDALEAIRRINGTAPFVV
jgi:phosphoribosyl isomerase A